MEYPQPLMRYNHTNNSLLSSGNTKKSSTYEPRTEAISPAINDDILNAEDSTSKSTKDEQTLIVEKLKKVEAEILQTDLQIVRLRRQKEQLEQAANNANRDDDDQENVCDTKQLSIAKLVYHENRAKAQRAHAKLDSLGGVNRDLPIYNQPTDNVTYHHNAAKFNYSFKASLVSCFKARLENRLKLEESVSAEYDRRMEKWLKSIEIEDSQPSKRIKDAKAREFFEKQFPELKKARESGERFSRVGQRVARSDAEVAELLDGITEREDQDKKIKSYAVIPPMLEEMRSRKPKYINRNGFVEDIIAEYKEYQILNTWTDEERDIFKENYLLHPKNFGLISRMTNRKNVANCVHYYYLSKKSENYKQLLKRQQKRRTRSFVRPAQATPANNTIVESNDSNNKSKDSEKQAGESALPDASNSSKNDDGLSSAPSNSIDHTPSDNSDAKGDTNDQDHTCCICRCNFDDNNQSRNVTRSNHQIYGINIELLKPGLKICSDCRFRHVRYPSSDETNAGTKDSNDDIPGNENDPDRMDLTDSSKGSKRACVRDIIYQAIEMSFQKPETIDSKQYDSPVRPQQPQRVRNQVQQQHPPVRPPWLDMSIQKQETIESKQYDMPVRPQQPQPPRARHQVQQQHPQIRPTWPMVYIPTQQTILTRVPGQSGPVNLSPAMQPLDLTSSRSPHPIESPTSPSEMVIDESAEAITSPPDHDDEESNNR